MTSQITVDRRLLEEMLDPSEPGYDGIARGRIRELLEAPVNDDEIMRAAAMRHINRMLPESDRVLVVRICPSKERDRDGMLEWLLCYEFERGGKLTVGLIQRQPGGPVESHS